jgi:catechol 2,3-dioxygenase-like lactoylglutathione lyase family enzyme
MKFQPIVPMIWTKELQKTVDFYCDILDLLVEIKVKNGVGQLSVKTNVKL